MQIRLPMHPLLVNDSVDTSYYQTYYDTNQTVPVEEEEEEEEKEFTMTMGGVGASRRNLKFFLDNIFGDVNL